MNNQELHFETLQVHAAQTVDPVSRSRAVPIYQTASYVFEDAQNGEDLFHLQANGNIYSRLTNPTNAVFEERVAILEGGAAGLAVSSGAAAITFSILNIAGTGDHIVAAATIYGGTYNLLANTLPNYGITATFVQPDEPLRFEEAIKENTKAIFIESLGNPNTNIIDIEAVAEIAHQHGIPLIVDNTFGTPYLIRPISFGADIVVHSATKFIGGHGTSLGGVIVDSGKFDWEVSGKFPKLVEPEESYHGISFTKDVGSTAYITRIRTILLRDIGACLSPFHSFLFLQGLETLSLRMERHVQNARAIAQFLFEHDFVEQVNYVGLPGNPYNGLAEKYFPNGTGSIFTIQLRGGAAEAKRFIDHLEIFSDLANVADAKSLAVHPAGTTHSQLSAEQLKEAGIYPNTVRLSIGIENAEDLIRDIKQALKKTFA